MNVLESLKIKNATILNIKDNDIILVKVTKECSTKEMAEIQESLIEAIRNRNLKNIGLWITPNIDDIKIIRR